MNKQQKASSNGKSKSIEKTQFRKFILIFWGILFLIALVASSLMYGIVNEWFGELPSTKKLENPETNLATKVFSEDGELLGKYFTHNRSNVNYDKISPHMINALISTEDARFYSHSGIDIQALFRVAFFRILLGREEAGGGSTITQQLAKNLFPRKSFETLPEIVIRKLKEWVIAVKLERYYTKQEILTMYLNTVDFGSSSYGIQAASNTFYNKPPDSLEMTEAATLVGVLKATHYYSPVYNPENAKQRRNVVLNQLAKRNHISEEALDSLKNKDLSIDYTVESHNQGRARYFRSYISQELSDWCAKNGYNLYTDGLKIYTTLNSRMQSHAEQVVKKHMKDLQQSFDQHWKGKGPPWGKHDEIIDKALKNSERYIQLDRKGLSEDSIKEVFRKPVEMTIFTHENEAKEKDTIMSPLDSIKYYKKLLRTGFMAMRPSNGHVKAWVGGLDFKYFKYDHVSPYAKRQVGSTFKPFVYTVAVANGFSPCYKVPNRPVVFEEYDNWKPKNASGEYGGMVPIKDGLGKSINCVTAYLIKEVGPESVVQLAKRMGIQSKMEPYPSISLGTPDISVYEMVSAFNTYANKGVWTEPTMVTRIEDKNGNVLEEFVPKTKEVLDETTNYIMLDMLKHVVDNGTARRLRYKYNLKNPLLGKTGTTQNQSDGWFLGAAPNLTGGAWVGGDNRSVHFRSISLGQGANTALPIWANFMKKCYDDPHLNVSKDSFAKPREELPVEIDCTEFDSEEKENEDVLDF